VHIDVWLQSIPVIAVCLVVGGLVLIESLGVPIPGETILITAAVLVSTHKLSVSPLWLGASASAGAIIGDSIGYAIGRKWGHPLFDWLGRKVPKHFGPSHVAYAEHIFSRWGVLAVFVGRFIALLRIFAGPLSGALELPYPKFLAANALGGICWAGGLTAAIYYLGESAQQYFGKFSWIALLVAVVGGLIIGLIIKRRVNRHAERTHDERASAPAAGLPESE
jgi:membrane protein DedA with SNARE-associated domain